MGLLLILVSLLAPALVALLFLPKTLHLVAGLVGQHLRRSSRTRRELLLARVENETKAYEAEGKSKKKEDDDWEQVGGTPPSSAVKGDQADSEWDGIVGFFHPFWYVWRAPKDVDVGADRVFPQQCGRRRRTSPLGCHSSTPEALAKGDLYCLYR